MKLENKLIDTALLLAVVTGFSYSFGAYFDYRLRYEFNIQNITLDQSPEIIIRDGFAILFSWLGGTLEFWIAVPLIILIIFLMVYVDRKFKSNWYILFFILIGLIFFRSVNHYIPTRAKNIEQIIKSKAQEMKHVLALKDGTKIKGYTIIGAPLKVAFLSSDQKALIIPYSEIRYIKNNDDV